MEIINICALRFFNRWSKCGVAISRRVIPTLLLALLPLASFAQTARQVLDKTAAVVAAKNGAQASFTMKGEHLNTSGTLAIKGRQFHATTPQAIIWFDGKTQWTYLKQNEEVSVANPSEAELAAINPYTFIYMYKQGYSSTLSKKGQSYEVHLTATDKKRKIEEMYITVNQKSYVPSQIRLKQKNGWVTIASSNFKATKLSDATFRFNAKDYPHAEVIDLR